MQMLSCDAREVWY